MGVKTVFHAIAATHFWYGCYYDWHYVKLPTELTRHTPEFESYNKLKYLTYWNALLQSLFFTVCFINDIIGNNENVPKTVPFVRKLRNLVLPCLAFPLSMFVGLTFWGLYAIDRELIFPTIMDRFFPSWLNHVMHTNIIVFILIEMLTTYQKYPIRRSGLTILGAFMLTYLVWIHYIYIKTNIWVYPILNVLNLPFRILFYVGLLALSVALYLLGEKLNNSYWKSLSSKSQKTK